MTSAFWRVSARAETKATARGEGPTGWSDPIFLPGVRVGEEAEKLFSSKERMFGDVGDRLNQEEISPRALSEKR